MLSSQPATLLEELDQAAGRCYCYNRSWLCRPCCFCSLNVSEGSKRATMKTEMLAQVAGALNRTLLQNTHASPVHALVTCDLRNLRTYISQIIMRSDGVLPSAVMAKSMSTTQHMACRGDFVAFAQKHLSLRRGCWQTRIVADAGLHRLRFGHGGLSYCVQALPSSRVIPSEGSEVPNWSKDCMPSAQDGQEAVPAV